MYYNKPSLTITQQLSLLQERGIIFEDINEAKKNFEHISYYKLSGYWHTFLEEPATKHVFKLNTSFKQILDTYNFDKKLRIILFNHIERIEISFKTHLIHEYSLAYGSHWFDDSSLYRNNKAYCRFIDILREDIRCSKETFIKHYLSKYDYPELPPVWMSLEICSLGQISMLFKNLKVIQEKKRLSKSFGVDHVVLESWIESLAFIRNICAHHSRLWNKQLTIKPTIPKFPSYKWIKILPSTDKQDRIYLIIAIIQYLSKIIDPNTNFRNELLTLLNEYENLPQHYMGFPEGWMDDAFWN